MSKKFLTVANQTIRVSINIEQIVIGITYATGADADGVGGGKCLVIESLNGKVYLIGTKKAILAYTDGRPISSCELQVVLETEEATNEAIKVWEEATMQGKYHVR